MGNVRTSMDCREGDNGKEVAMANWSEVDGYPGVVIAYAAATGRPFILYFGPDNTLHTQEIVVNSKTKVTTYTLLVGR